MLLLWLGNLTLLYNLVIGLGILTDMLLLMQLQETLHALPKTAKTVL